MPRSLLWPNHQEVALVRRIRLADIARDDAIALDSIPESDRRVARLHINGRFMHPPTAAMIHRFCKIVQQAVAEARLDHTRS